MNKQKLTIVAGLTLSVVALAIQEKPIRSVKPSSTNLGVIDKFYVGADNACDFNTIQAAVNSASNSQNPSEVLISNNQIYNDTLFLDHNNITLNGQFSDCSEARLGITTQGKSTILGQNNGSPTIHIIGSNVSLKNIILIENIDGGILADGTSAITAENMVFSSLGPDVSAIKINGLGLVNLQIINSEFSFNTAPQGAAINCFGSNHIINIASTSITDNEAIGGSINAYGGAIYADGCDFPVHDTLFQNNRADFGGGVYLISSNIELNSTTFKANTAQFSSGALVASNSIIDADGVHFIDNQSIESLAGAIGLVNSTLNLTKSIANCKHKIKCNYFSNNKAGFAAGAIGSESGNINIAGTYFENNRADFGSALYLTGLNSTRVEGSVFIKNGNGGDNDFLDQSVAFLQGDAIARIAYSTFADNNITSSTFNQTDNSQLSVYSSIIHDPNSGNVFETGAGSALNVNCLIVHETASFISNNAEVITSDPMFVDPTNGDYHINAVLSPAVDYCSDTLAMAQHLDIDGEERGFEDPTVTNHIGPYDIGADETYGNDIIFRNSYEQ